jgi:two-component system, NarL family, response regulator LiaR
MGLECANALLKDMSMGAQNPRRILIAEDNASVRLALTIFISGNPDMLLVGEAENGTQAVALSLQLEMDIIVLDLNMPELDGIAVIQAIKRVKPAVPILVLTAELDENRRQAALDAGAVSIVSKGTSIEQLGQAIRTYTYLF